jgi:gamma-glutamylcyclotransferase (GGCT)/AIG2-like uncharacterized protein YtfP
LKPGLSLYHVVEPFVTRSLAGTTRGRLYDAEVPAARFDEDGEIDGFVFWLDDARAAEAIAILDDVEDEGEMYARIEIDVATDDGVVRAQAYQYLLPLAGRRTVGRTWQPKD